MFGAGGTDDGGGDAFLGEHPGDGGVGDRASAEVLLECGDLGEVGFVPVALAVARAGVAERKAGVVLEVFGIGVLAGQEAAGERVVGDDADALVAAERQQVGFDIAPEDVIARLVAVEAGEAGLIGRGERQPQLPGAVVGRAGVADFAPAAQVVERLHRLLDRRVAVGPVQLVEVDVVGLQAAQRLVDGGEDVLARRSALVGVVAHRREAFGGEHDAVARLGLEPAPDDFLGGSDGVCADGVDIGGVDEVDAAVGGGGHDALRLRLFGLEAEGHGAEADFGDAEAGASHASVVHCGSSPFARRASFGVATSSFGALVAYVSRRPRSNTENAHEIRSVVCSTDGEEHAIAVRDCPDDVRVSAQAERSAAEWVSREVTQARLDESARSRGQRAPLRLGVVSQPDLVAQRLSR